MIYNKTVIITGASVGIGKATAIEFARNGANVCIVDVNAEGLDTLAEEIKSIGANVSSYICDVSDEQRVHEITQEIINQYGKIDILVNNAGVSAMESIYNYDPASFDKVMNINVNAVFYAIRAVAPIMKNNGGGVILNTSSMVSLHGQPAGVAYPASKFALNGMTKSLARELAKDNIRVNAVAPGVTDTDMVANLPEQVRESIKQTIPLGRIGTPEDVANAFLYLASDNASYVTGEILSVDGCART